MPAMVAEHKPLKVPVERKESSRAALAGPQPIVRTAAPVTRPAGEVVEGPVRLPERVRRDAGPHAQRAAPAGTAPRRPTRVLAVTLVRVRSRNRCRW